MGVRRMGKRTVVDRVREHLTRDIVMSQCMARGFLNLRRSARWMQDHGLHDCSLEAIVSALSRWQPTSEWLEADGWQLLEAADLSVATGWLVVDIDRSYETVQRLGQLQQRLDPGDASLPLYGLRTIRLAIPGTYEQEIRDTLGLQEDDQEARDAVRIHMHRDGETPPSLLATNVALRALGSAGIEVLATYHVNGRRDILVPKETAREAYDIATEVMRT